LFVCVLVRVSIANSYTGKHFIGIGLQFRGSVRYSHGGKCSSVQTDMLLEKELQAVYLNPQAAGKELV
jgi:threonyl-tRNA synthetase